MAKCYNVIVLCVDCCGCCVWIVMIVVCGLSMLPNTKDSITSKSGAATRTCLWTLAKTTSFFSCWSSKHHTKFVAACMCGCENQVLGMVTTSRIQPRSFRRSRKVQRRWGDHTVKKTVHHLQRWRTATVFTCRSSWWSLVQHQKTRHTRIARCWQWPESRQLGQNGTVAKQRVRR